MMYWDRDGMSGWAYAGMGLGTVLMCALLILGIVVLVRLVSTDRGSQAAVSKHLVQQGHDRAGQGCPGLVSRKEIG